MGFLLFFSGCLYQSGAFLAIYIHFPTAVELNIQNTPSLEFPAVTICNNNKVRQQEWCKADPSVCERWNNESLVAYTQRLRNKYAKLTKPERIKMGYQLKDFILFAEYDEKDYDGSITRFYDYEYTNCFTFNAQWGAAEMQIADATLFNPVSGKSSELLMCVNMGVDNYSPLTNTVRTRVSIHATDTVPNPRYDGVSIQPGSYYSYGIKKETVRLLEKPYQTNCRNYSEEKETRTGGKMSQENCLLECFKNATVKLCGCSYPRLSLLYDVKSCEDEIGERCLDGTHEETKQICYSECRMACNKVSYSFVATDSEPLREESPIYQRMNVSRIFPTFEKTIENMACLDVHYGSTESTLLSHRPKYESIETFSLIGGYSGLWLGFSLLTAYTFVLSALKSLKNRMASNKKITAKEIRHRKVRTTFYSPQDRKSGRFVYYKRN